MMAFEQQTYGHGTRSQNRSGEESNTDLTKIKELRLKSFAEDTTLHGARFLFADNIFRRLLWTVAILACLCYCGYQVCVCVIEFYKWPFNTKITTHSSSDNGDEFFFPAMTLCNLNFFNTRRFREYLSGRFSEEEIERLLKDTSLMSSGSKEVLSKEFRQRNPFFFERLGQEEPTNDTKLKMLREISKGIVSHQIDEMLLPSCPELVSCSIGGKRCDARNFTRIMTFMYGRCYTFNSAEGGKSLLRATSAGKNSGLKLRLNIERKAYLRQNSFNPFVGLAILIHDQKTFPSVMDYGIKVQPGVSTACAIKRRKIVNLEKPYATNCTKRTLHMFNSDSYTAYTKAACLFKCRNEYTVKTCGCTPVEYKEGPSVPICSASDIVFCVLRSYEEFGASKEKKQCEKNCPEPCEQVEYTTSFSYSGLQREAFIEPLVSLLNGTGNASVNGSIYKIYKPLLNMTGAEREKYIDDNVVAVDIYFEDLSYNVIEQTPRYQTWALLGNLGGTFGLFLGMSFLTLLEFLDFTFRKISYFFHRKTNPSSDRDDDLNPQPPGLYTKP